MSRSKKPKQPKKAKARQHEPLIWPPEEWPEEAKQAEIAAIREFMDKWWEFVYAGFDSPMPQTPRHTAEIIPFPGTRKQSK